jgi:hypothetical protein
MIFIIAVVSFVAATFFTLVLLAWSANDTSETLKGKRYRSDPH